MADISVTLKWSWLKYDIDQETFKSAKCLITEDASGEKTMEAQTADDTFDLDFCKRKITEGCSKVQDALHKFFSSVVVYDEDDAEITVSADNTLLTDAASWVLTFTNLGDRRNVDSKLLASELHQYIVLYVLQEWSKLAMPLMEKNYVDRLVAEENRVKSIVYRKEEPSRPE